MLLLFLLVPDRQREKLQMSLCPFNIHLSSIFLFPVVSYSQYSLFRNHSSYNTDTHTHTQHTNTQTRQLRERCWPRPVPRQRDGQTDRKRESGRVYLRTDGELGQSAAQPLRDCLQLFQLRLLTPALLAQDLVLQPLVTLSKTQHTCSKTQPCSHRCAAAPVSPGPVFKHVTLSSCCLQPQPGKHISSYTLYADFYVYYYHYKDAIIKEINILNWNYTVYRVKTVILILYQGSWIIS